MVSGRAKPYQLLIADDDSNFREVLKSIFEPYLQLFEAASGEAAIEIVEDERIDIVLLDMHMDVLTGLETLQVVKSINAVIPCILVTGDVTEELKRDATAADAYSVLGKPIRKGELVSTVSTALEDAYSDPDALSAWQ